MFIKDIIKTIFFVKNREKDVVDKFKGCDLILGDWGSGKTHYFNHKYKEEHKYSESIMERISCFSYTREDFIKQLVAINFWNRWLSLNGILSGYISFNWHKMLPKNKVIFIDDLERLPCDKNMTNDFIGIINELKKHNRVVIACSLSDIKETVIGEYLEKTVDFTPHEITLDMQISLGAIIGTIQNTAKNITCKKDLISNIDNLCKLLENDFPKTDFHTPDGIITYRCHRCFTELFFKNSVNAINLRTIKKVFINIYKQENASEIINTIIDIVYQPSIDISVENIKNYYIYLKVKNLISEYLSSYDLLFAYPDIKEILIDLDDDLSKEQLEKELNRKTSKRHIDKAIFIYEINKKNVNKKYDDLSFNNCEKIIKEISKISKISDNEFKLMLLMGSPCYHVIAQEVERHFLLGDNNVTKPYDFNKKICYEMFNNKIDTINDDTESDRYELYLTIESSIITFERNIEYWECIIDEYSLETLNDTIDISCTYNLRLLCLNLKFGDVSQRKSILKKYRLEIKNLIEATPNVYLFDLFINISKEQKISIEHSIKFLTQCHTNKQYDMVIDDISQSATEEYFDAKYKLIENYDSLFENNQNWNDLVNNYKTSNT